MSGSVFRRGGQKVEAHGNPSEQQISGLQLEAKLAALRKSWSAPLTACVLVSVATVSSRLANKLSACLCCADQRSLWLSGVRKIMVQRSQSKEAICCSVWVGDLAKY